MLPLFLPPGVTFDKLLRALIGVALFASAYMAEVVRGGLQAIPKGQYEGADSLGLGYWQKMGLDRPAAGAEAGHSRHRQHLHRHVQGHHPGAASSRCSTCSASSSRTFRRSPTGRRRRRPRPGYVFAGFVFWLFCFGMSRYSMYMERRLDTGHRRYRDKREEPVHGHRKRSQRRRDQGRCRAKMHISDTDVAIEIIGMHKWYGDFHVLKDINLQGDARRAHRHLRAVRLRQVDDDPLHQPRWRSTRRARSSSTARNSPTISRRSTRCAARSAWCSSTSTCSRT